MVFHFARPSERGEEPAGLLGGRQKQFHRFAQDEVVPESVQRRGARGPQPAGTVSC